MPHCEDFPQFEQDIIDKIRNGNENEAFRIIYDCTYQYFIDWGKKNFSRFRSDDDFFNDAFQESIIMFRELVRRKANFEPKIQLKAFLTEVIGKRWILKFLRKNGAISSLPNEEIGEVDNAIASILDEIIEEELLHEDIGRIEKLLNIAKKNAYKCYRLLKYIFYEEKNNDEICTLMNFKNKKVLAVRKFRCLEYIKKLLS